MHALSVMSFARRMAQLSPRAKVWIMVGGDALFLPLCMLASVALRLGSLEHALMAAPVAQLLLAWMTLPVVVVLICFLWLDGPSFYTVALSAGALAVYGLMRRFQLFRGEDAVFFESLRLSAPLLPGISFAARRR